jgi:hypothetical protein
VPYVKDTAQRTHLHLLRNREEFVSKWAPLVGEDAAETFLAGTNRLGIASLLTPVWGILLVVERQWEMLALALSALALGIALATSGFILIHRFNRLVSERFGIRVRALNSPNLREGQFQRWCKFNGLAIGDDSPMAS